MSKTIDEKVVEMRFDNKHFESNVQTTMSTLDKLKAKLNLTGASKGLEELNKASNKFNLNGMSNALETVSLKFSALEFIGMTALANITNKAVDAGSALVKSLSIDQLTEGWKKYEQQTASVQTLVNSTGKSVNEIEKYLNKLMWYSDETSYGFTDMTSALATMTSSGGDIEKLIPMIEGIANATAFAGKGAAEFSRVMQFGINQAYALGYMQVQDWKTIESATVNSKQLQESLISAAESLGKIKKGTVTIENFRASLKDKWLDQSVMELGFGQFSKVTEEIYEGIQSGAFENYADGLKQIGNKYGEVAQRAAASAQEAKTFQEAIVATKDAVSSQWMDLWKSIFGNYDQAKVLWTDLANYLYDTFVTPLKSFKERVQAIMSFNPFQGIIDKIENSGIGKMAEKIDGLSKSLEYYQEMVNKVWKGDYKNQPYRKGLLEAEGHDFDVIQTLVNKGYQYKLTVDDVAAAEKKYGIVIETVTENIEELSDEQLRNAKLTEDEIKMYRKLQEQSKATGKSISELLSEMKNKTGRDLFIGAFQNFGTAISSVLKSIGNAWNQAFPPKSELQIYRILEAFNKFSEIIKNRVLLLTEDADGKLSAFTRTLRGLFSILHIITSFVGTGFKLAFKVLEGVLSAFNISVLDFTALIGDAIYKFDRWLTENNVFVESIKKMTEWIVKSVIATKDWIAQNEKIMDVINRIKEAFSNIGSSINTWIQGLKETENIPKYIFGGLVKGIQNEAPKVYDAIKKVANGIIETICKILKIHSPSKVMIAIGGFLILGIIQGLKDGSSTLFDFIGNLCQSVIDLFKQIDLGDIIAVGMSSGLIYIVKRMLDITDKLLAPIQSLTNVMNGLSSVLSGVGAAARDFGTSMKYQGIAAIIKSIAISIGILAASLLVLAKLPDDQLKQGAIALGIIGLALAVFIGLVAALSDKLAKAKLPDIGKILVSILGLSVGMLILSKALRNVAKIEPDRILPSVFGLIACAAAMAILLLTLGKVTEALKGTKNIEKMGKVFTKMAISMLLISVALKMMSKIEPGTIWKMIGVMAAMLVLLGGIAALNHFTGNSINKSADTIKAVGVALVLLIISMKLAGGLKKEDFLNGIKVIGVFSLLLLAMMGISKLFKGTEMIKVTASILMATIAIGMLAVITKLIGNINPDEMKKGLKCVGVLSAIIMALILVSKQSASLHGTTLIGVTMVMAAMGVMVFLLGQLDPEKAKNGIKAVGAISIFMAILLQAAKNFKPGANSVKTLTTLTVMISLLAVALIGLSFIDQQRLMTTAGSLGTVMLSLAAVIAATNKLKVGKGVIKTLLTITLVVAAMAGIVALLSHFTDPNGAIASAGALSLLLVACGAIVVAMSKFKVNAKNAAKGALALTAMAVPLLAFTGVLVLLSTIDASKALPNVLSLIVLVGAMTGLLAALTAISAIGNIANMTLGVLGLTLMAVPLLAFVGILALMQNVDRAMENVKALTLLATACTLLLIPLTAIGAIVATGVGALAVGGGILALTLMAVPLLAFVGVLAVMQGIENATQNVELLTTMMEKMTVCLLALSLVAPLALIADAAIFGLIGAITTIGVLATAVGAIMDKFPQLQDFLNKGLPVLEQIALSIGKIIGNVVAGFMNSVADELPHTGEKLSEFAVKALPFITIMSSVSNRMTEGAKAIASSLLVLTGASLLDGIATFINGGESFSRLGIELSKFAVNALPFLTILSSVDPTVLEGSKALASAVLEFTKANFLDTITSWINGESDLGSFGAKLAPLGTGMKEFVTNLGTFSDDQVTTVKSACDALKAIAEVAGEIPKHGGMKQAFTGDNDIEAFGKKLGPTGTAIKEFVTNLGTFDDKQVTTVKSACDALKAIAEVAGEIPKHGGMKQAFTGDNDISTFAGKLGEVAKGIRGFVWELQKDNVITQDSIAKINAVNNIMWAIADLGKINLGDTSGKLEELGARLCSFGNKITEYVKGINTVSLDDLQSGKDKIDKIIEISNTLAAVNSDPIEKLGEKLKNFATDALKKFVDGLNDTQPRDDASNAMKSLIDAIIKAMGEKDDDIKTGATNIIETATKALESSNHTDRASKAGLNILNGFINGMNDKDGRVWNKAYSIGRTAVDAINKATDEHSPSKETFKTGKFFDQGFINGIKSLEDKIYSETYGVGDKARLGLGRAIRGVSNLISEGIDDEFTIRPVLDLSDVQSGAAAINGMLGVPSVGVAANLNAISTGMRTYRQNGGDDVISAIDKLGKNLGNTTGDTYNINGITYDNGSEIQEAVSTLVRAARIERRT